MMTADELGVIRSVLVQNKVVAATASDGDVAAAHAAMLQGPQATEYKAALEAGGVKTGLNWLTIIGVAGGAVALYFIWRHYNHTEQIDAREYPDPQHQMRGIRGALGTLRMGGQRGCGSRMGRLGASQSAPRAFPYRRQVKYEFEPEVRLEGYRRRKARK
jgi:hypothetical protein